MAEKRVIELEVKDNTKTLKQQYKEAVIELQRVAQTYGETSQQAAEAAKRAASLKDAIEDTNDAIAAFKGEGAFNAVGKAVGSVASGFSAVEGAIGLVGVESEKLQETMLRVQSAMALAQGLEGLEDAGRAFKQLGTVAINALKGIRTAIGATGIGLLVIALGTIVAYWDDIKEAVSGVSSEQEALNVKTEENLKMSEEKVAALDKQDNILKLQGKTEKQILQFKIAELDTAIKIAEVNIENQKVTKAAQIEAAKRNKDILVGILDFLTSPINVLLKTIDKIASVVGIDSKLVKGFDAIKSAAANIVFDPAETAKEGDLLIKAAEERFIELKNQKAGYELQIQAIDKQAADARRQAQKDADAKRLADEKEANDKLKEELERAQKEKEFILTEDIEEGLRQQLVDSEAAKDKIRQEAIAKQEEDELALMQFKGDIYKQDIDNTFEAEEQKQQARQKAFDLALKTAQTFGQVYGGLNNLLNASDNERLKSVKKGSKEEEAIKKRMFERDKKLRIVQTIIDTASNVVTSVRNGGGIPTGIPFGVAAGVMGALQIAAISKTKFEGSSGGGGGDTTVPPIAGADGVMAPNFNLVGNAQATNPLAGLGEGLIQAYVVSGDVTTAQSLDRNRVNNATFG
jgi:hypothetical protein